MEKSHDWISKIKGFMRLKIYLLLLCTQVVGCTHFKKLYNDFGVDKQLKEYSAHYPPIRIYFDRWGAIYPQYTVQHKLFQDNCSVLESVYTHVSELKSAFEAEGIPYKEDASAKDNFELLQRRLVENYIANINQAATDKELVFLIHGYNNTAETAFRSLEKLRVTVAKRFPATHFQFVEIYWDGLHNEGRWVNSLRIWDNAQYSAARVGLGLRRILSGIKHTHNYVVTHSHGAGVITEALFNVRRFKEKFYHSDPDGKIINMLQERFDTPKTQFVIGMLAPAIPGTNVFDEYACRTVDGRNQKVQLKNYRFINGFNKYDHVTSKWKFAGIWGATTLACREKEHRAVSQLFHGDQSIYNRVNFSEDRHRKQTSHVLPSYIDNPRFSDFIDQVFHE